MNTRSMSSRLSSNFAFIVLNSSAVWSAFVVYVLYLLHDTVMVKSIPCSIAVLRVGGVLISFY